MTGRPGNRRSRDIPALVDGRARRRSRGRSPGWSRWSRTPTRACRELAAALAAPYTGRPRSSGSPARPAWASPPLTNELVRALPGGRHAGRRAGGRPVQPVHRRGDPRRPGPDAGPRHRPGRLHPVDVQPRATSAGCPRPPRRRSGCWRAPAATSCIVETVGVGQAEVEVASPGRHHAGAARPRHGRRDPGGEGRHPGDRRRLRGQQGRPGRRRRRRTRHPGHDRARDRASRASGARRSSASVAARGEGIDDVVAAIDKHRAWLVEHGQLQAAPRGAGPRPRSRRSRSAPCAAGSDRCATARPCRTWPPSRGRRRRPVRRRRRSPGRAGLVASVGLEPALPSLPSRYRFDAVPLGAARNRRRELWVEQNVTIAKHARRRPITRATISDTANGPAVRP